MEEHKKHELIENCETIEQLKNAIDMIGPIKVRNGNIFQPEKMKRSIDMAYHTGPMNVAPRYYGIRQQILYIYYHEKMEQLINSN